MNRARAADWQFVNALISILNRPCVAAAGTRDSMPRPNVNTASPTLPDFASARTVLRLLLLGLLMVTAVITDAAIFVMYQFDLTPERWPAWRGPLLVRSLLITAIVGWLLL